MVPFIEMGTMEGILGVYNQNQEFSSGHTKLEMPMRHPSGAVKWAVEHVILELSHDLMSCGLLRFLGEGRSQKRGREAD